MSKTIQKQARLTEEDYREIEGILKNNDSISHQSAYNALPLLLAEIRRLHEVEAEREWLADIIKNDTANITRLRKALLQITQKSREDGVFEIANNALESINT